MSILEQPDKCNTPISCGAGTYAVLKPKEGKVPKFLYPHLDTCTAGAVKPGQQFAAFGDTGVGTDAHLDVRQIEVGNSVNPTREWVERIVMGGLGR